MKRSLLIFLLGLSIGSGATAVAFYAYLPRELTEFSGKHKVKGQGNSMSIENIKQQLEADCERQVEEAVKAALKAERKARRKRKN